MRYCKVPGVACRAGAGGGGSCWGCGNPGDSGDKRLAGRLVQGSPQAMSSCPLFLGLLPISRWKGTQP